MLHSFSLMVPFLGPPYYLSTHIFILRLCTSFTCLICEDLRDGGGTRVACACDEFGLGEDESDVCLLSLLMFRADTDN